MPESQQKTSVVSWVNILVLLFFLLLLSWFVGSKLYKTAIANNSSKIVQQKLTAVKLNELLDGLTVADIPAYENKFLVVEDLVSKLQSEVTVLQNQQGATGSNGARGPAGQTGATGSSGTNGADGDAFFTQVGSDIYYSGGNFGLGTSSPQEPLHVIGNARISSLISCDTIDSDANGVLVCGVDATGAGGSLTGSGTNGQVGYFNGGTSLASSANLLFDGNDLNVASGTLFVDQSASRVGIGTITPGVTLDVNGTFAARSTTNAIFGNGSIGGIQLGDGTITKVPGKYFVWNTGIRLNSTVGKSIVFGPDTLDGTDYTIKSDSHLALYSSSLERLRIDTSGNLGIGTTSPASLMSVGASNQFQVSSAGLVTYVAGTTDTATSVCRNAAGQLAGCSTTETGAAFVQGGNSFGATATLGTNDNQALNFITNGTARCSIAATGGLSCPGAGTDSEVFGAGATTQTFDNSVALGNSARVNNNNSVAIGKSSTSGQESVAVGSSSSANGISVAIGHLARATGTNSVAVGRYAQSGFIGSIAIGREAQTTAGYQLVVGGSANTTQITSGYFGNGVTNSSPLGFTLNATGGSGTDIAGANLSLASGRATGSALGGDILFQTSDAGASGTTLRNLSTKLVVKASGKVGIGTTDPNYILSLYGSAPDIHYDHTTGNDYILGNASGSFRLRNVTANRTDLVVTSAGNVGIAETAPGAKLHVNTGAAGTVGQIIKGAASQTADLLQAQDSTGAMLAKIDASGNITSVGLTLSGLDCTGNTNGGALTANASGVISCSDDDSGGGGGGGFTDDGTVIRLTTATDSVGLGTTNPQTNLHIFGTSAIITHQTGNNGISGTDYIETDGGNAFGGASAWGFRVGYNGPANQFQLQSGSATTVTTRLVVDRDLGYVGIGDTSPLYLLTVGSGDLFGVNSSGDVLFEDSAHSISVNTETTANTIGNALTVSAGAANGSTTGAVGGALNLNGGAAAGSGNNNGGAINISGGSATGSGSIGSIILQNGGGDVMIGTSNSGGRFTVNSGNATSQIITLRGASSYTGDFLRVNDGSGNRVLNLTTISSGNSRGQLNLYLTQEGTPTNYERLTQYADSTNSIFRIEAQNGGTGTLRNLVFQGGGGNVGIGDTSPIALLTVGNGDLFQVNSSGAIAAVTGITASGVIQPNAAGTINLGSTTAEFSNLFLGDDNGLKLGLDQDATLAYDETTDDRVELSGTGASLFIEDRLSLGAQSYVIADNFVPATRASGTLTPTSSYTKGTCSDSDGCTITMGESAAKDGDTLIFINTGANEFRFADTAGVTEIAGQADLGIHDSITMIYNGSAWVELSRSNN